MISMYSNHRMIHIQPIISFYSVRVERNQPESDGIGRISTIGYDPRQPVIPNPSQPIANNSNQPRNHSKHQQHLSPRPITEINHHPFQRECGIKCGCANTQHSAATHSHNRNQRQSPSPDELKTTEIRLRRHLFHQLRHHIRHRIADHHRRRKP